MSVEGSRRLNRYALADGLARFTVAFSVGRVDSVVWVRWLKKGEVARQECYP